MKTRHIIWRLFRFCTGGYLFMGLLCCLIYGIVPQATGLITREFFDLLSGAGRAGFNLYTLCALLVVVALSRSALFFVNVPIHYKTQVAISTLVRKNLLTHILSRPGARALPGSPGEAISRFRGDVEEIAGFLGQMPFLVGRLLFAVVAVAIMFQIHPTITLVVFAPLVFVVAIVNRALSRIHRYRQARREANGQVAGFIGELFAAVQTIKFAHAEDRAIARFDRLNDHRRRTTLKDRVFNALMDAIVRNTVNLGIGAILILIGQAMRTGVFTVGDFALFVFYLTYVTDITQMTGRMIARYKQVGVSIARLDTLLQGGAPCRLGGAQFRVPQRRSSRRAPSGAHGRRPPRHPGNQWADLPLSRYGPGH